MKKWMGRVFMFMGMALMAFPVLQLEYGKARTGEMLEVVENEMEERKVSVAGRIQKMVLVEKRRITV